MEGTGGTKHALKGMDSPENGDINSVPSACEAWRVDEWTIRQEGMDSDAPAGHSKKSGLRAPGEGSPEGPWQGCSLRRDDSQDGERKQMRDVDRSKLHSVNKKKLATENDLKIFI